MVGTNLFTSKTSTVDVALTDTLGNARLIKCTVSNLPTGAGYAIGCIAMTEAGALYSNTGTTTTASFVIVSTTTSGSVTLAMLATAVAPSHIVKYAGLSTVENDADASVVISVSGVAATDVVTASILAQAGTATILKVVPTTDTITVTLSGNGGEGTQIAYSVLRATA